MSSLSSEKWRLNNLYYIKNKQGKKVKFNMNWAQSDLFSGMWYLNLILKARQLGMTTFIQLFMLDRCLFNSNVNAGVIAHNRDDAQKFFKDKIKFAYDNLPADLKGAVKATNDSAGELMFANGSSIRVGTSLRSGTYQYLHISEFGKLCAKFPDRATEVVTGSLNTVAAGQFVYIESTAEGAHGHFYDMCQEAEKAARDGSKLTKMDYKFWFYPWYEHPEYQLDEKVESSEKLDDYFKSLKKHDINLTDNQKAWYTKKYQEQRLKMKQEYPSTPEEAFEQVTEYSVYGEEIGEIIESGRLCELPFNQTKPVDIFFDIGKSAKAESTSAWIMQYNNPWYDFVDYYQASLKTVGGYVNDILAKGYRIQRWYIPHDAGSQKDYEIKTFEDRLIEAGVPRKDIVVVPKVSDLKIGIDQTKEKLPYCRFHKDNTKKGWRALCAYRYEWDEKKSIMGAPVHNWASHPSDAIRQFGQGFTPFSEPIEAYDPANDYDAVSIWN